MSDPKRKLLVTGASGFLGWNVCQAAHSDWDVYGTYRTHALDIAGTTLIQTELTDLESLRSLFLTLRPDGVIHTAAQARPQICQLNPAETYAINVTVPWAIANFCAEAQIPCVLTSTDFVFDGRHAPYRELDPTNPINHYGEQKVAAEEGMLARYPATAICRMPLMYGVSPIAPSFIQGFLKTLRSGQTLHLFTDEIRTPVSGRDAARGLLLALEKAQGYLHLGGLERVSRYEFGRIMIEALELTEAHIRPCLQAERQFDTPRPADLSMDSRKAFELGYAPGTVREELSFLKGKV